MLVRPPACLTLRTVVDLGEETGSSPIMDESAFESLTAAERGVLRAALGRTNDAVAAILGISPSTAAAHMLAARRKLGSPPRGEAALRFAAWEAHQQKSPSPFPPMFEPRGAEQDTETDADLVRDARLPFVFLNQPAEVARPTVTSDQVLPLLRTVMVLATVVLILACIRFLPDLRERAEEVGRVIDPLFRWAGVKRSG